MRESDLGNRSMNSPLKSILITDWSERHLAGHDLDGGGVESFDLETAVNELETLRYDMSRWNPGDIATLRVDPETHRATLRVVTPRNTILRVREFDLFDILHTVPGGEQGRHIYFRGTARNGATYVMPMLGYTSWEEAWDFSSVCRALDLAQKRQIRKGEQETALFYEMKTADIGADQDELKRYAAMYNDIFYPDSKQRGTPFDHAASFRIRSLSVRQNGPATRAQMFSAAFVRKNAPFSAGTPEHPTKNGTLFSPPYFEIDGEKIFIRTSAP